MRRTSVFLAALLVLAVASTASAQPEIDRVRCKVDPLIDDFGNPYNHVQIQVKVDSADPALPIDVWVTNEFQVVSPVAAGLLPIDGTATAEWDSSPDVGASTGVLLIDPTFVEIGETIVASTNVTGVAPVEAECKQKASSMFRQDTKPCKQKDYDRGRCSPVTSP